MPPTATIESGLETRTEETSELAPVAAGVGIEAEIKAAITVALRFPRNEDRAFEKLMRACSRTSFADDASYSFPRGDSDVSGPSIYLAREAARVWGNMRHGCDIIVDDDETRTIEAWAWDLETNTKITSQDSFKKLIFRKRGGWIKPDERDLRELTNRRAALAKRNCILEILPKDLIEDALAQADNTLKDKASRDPDGERKKILLAFSQINITATMLEQKLGHPVGQCSPAELAQLRKIYKSISDGNSKWADYVATPPAPKEPQRTQPHATQQPAPAPVAGPTSEGQTKAAPAQPSAPRAVATAPAKTSAVIGLVEDTRYVTKNGEKFYEVTIKTRAGTQIFTAADELGALAQSFEGSGQQVEGEWRDGQALGRVVKELINIRIHEPAPAELQASDIPFGGR